MKSKSVRFLTAFFLFLASCFSPPSQAAVPKLLTYQGILKDSGGNYLTGTYSMTFKIYDAAAAGNELWSETQSTISVSSGRFAVQLGSVTTLNLGFGSDYWLGIKVGTEAEMTPRVRLTSAGYAYTAENVVNSFTLGQHDSLSHKNIEGVRENAVNIAKTNFKVDAINSASANSMGDLIIDTFNDATGIDANQSSSYSWRGSPNYDVVAGSQGGIDSNTVLMLHANGTDGSSNFTDSSSFSKSVTAIGNAQIDTAQSKFAGASGLFDGSGDYLTVPDSDDWDLGTGDFTFDFWVRFNVVGTQVLIDRGDEAIFSIRRGADGVLKFTNNGNEVGTAWSPNTGQWYHIGVTRAGSTVRVFVDGIQIASGTNANNIQGTQALTVGSYLSGGSYFNGWIDELRVSKGIARWTSNFTPPTSEYTVPGSGNGTVISTLYTEPAVFSEALVIASQTPGTGSVTYYVSRNNGTNWTQCTNEQVCSLTAQPSGTQLRWKAVITGTAELDAIGVSV